jgi:1-pyrroline-5-carboxylate dehydrogenase
MKETEAKIYGGYPVSNYRVPLPQNEPVRDYAPGSADRAALDLALADLTKNPIDIPMLIGGRPVTTGHRIAIRAPHNHRLVLGHYHQGGPAEIRSAVAAARKAQASWADMAWQHRAAIFLKAADLLTGPYRHYVNAATMLAHSKNIFQAEIDAVCELADFWRYNAHFMQQIFDVQPQNQRGIWNRTDHRPLEGFVFAVTPFNFVSINGNLPTAPALLGNVALWKPASTAVYTSHFIARILNEAGLPAGVINMILAPGAQIGELVLKNPHLAGIHFTGSTATFQSMWRVVGENIAQYRNYPRIVGETGGKDFIVAHPSADCSALITAMVRGAFEYQGQKCSAASRCYIAESVWKQIEKPLIAQIKSLRMGDPADYRNFINAVIDENAFDTITSYIDYARRARDANILVGGKADKTRGYFIEPTLVRCQKPDFRLMQEEIFGPVLTVYVYKDRDFARTLKVCDQTSPYALTGAVFAQDRAAIEMAERTLRFAAGNFYINDKPTGAVVGQQPFGGARASGTNDKAGGIQNMLRWTSPRSIKETLVPPRDYRYPFMD